VLDAAAEVAGARGRRVTFEYACIEGINDRVDQAQELGRLLGSWPGVGGAHVNLIPLNPTPGSPSRPSGPRRIESFVRVLEAGRVNVTVRDTRGRRIDAACGQLRLEHANRPV